VTDGEPVRADDVARLGRLAGVEIPEEDLEAVGAALAAHCAFVKPMLGVDLAALPEGAGD
jgi:hypothetical protein